MRVIEKTVFTFDELSGEAKHLAYENWLSSDSYPWHDENLNSLIEFCDLTPINYRSINFEYGYGSFISYNRAFDFDECIDDLRGLRLAKYLYNNYAHRFMKGKFYSTGGQWINGKYAYKFRHSRITKSWQDCPLTGYCADHALLDPFFKFTDRPLSDDFKNWNIRDVFGACLDNWLECAQSDYEDYFSYDNFKEIAETTNWEYYENGETA